jgi:hypothetical protein
MPMARDELQSGIVIRLSPRPDQADFNVSGLMADSADFALTTEEDAIRKSGSGIGSISIWDKARTTIEQANSFLKPKQRVAFLLDVDRIGELPFDLHVFREPRPENILGADGHCALEDVWRADKNLRHYIQGRLAVIAGKAVKIIPAQTAITN